MAEKPEDMKKAPDDAAKDVRRTDKDRHARDTRAKEAPVQAPKPNSEFIRAENEDDDGYDPYSDRRPEPEPLFERDPWD